MNKIMYLLVLSLILSPSLFAELNEANTQAQADPKEQFEIPEGLESVNEVPTSENSKHPQNKLNALLGTRNVLSDGAHLVSSFSVFNSTNVVQYNPYVGDHGRYWFTLIQRFSTDNNLPRWTNNDLYEISSGSEDPISDPWDIIKVDSLETNQTIFWSASPGGVFPTLASTNPDAYDRVIYTQVTNYDFHNLTGGVREHVTAYTGEQSTFVRARVYQEVETNNSGDPQRFGAGDVALTTNEGNEGIHMVDRLSPTEENVQFGYYGYIGFAGLSDRGNVVPPEWYFDKFDNGNSDSQSSALTEPNIDSDELGNLYVGALANNLADFGLEDFFSPTVWISSDNGETWSDTLKCPKSLFDDWVESKTVDGQPAESYLSRIRFAKNQFVVTGVNEFSFFDIGVAAIQEGNSFNAEQVFILEASYKDGQWSLREVTEMSDIFSGTEDSNPFGSNFYYDKVTAVEESFNLPDNQWGLFVRANPRLFELEAAKTADGEHIILKYTDYRDADDVSSSGHVGPNYELPSEATYYTTQTNEITGAADTIAVQIDSIEVNDIFFAWRGVDETNWTVKNETNDDRSYIGTRLPSIVKSIDEIAVFYPRPVPTDSLQTLSAYYDGLKTLPPQMADFVSHAFDFSIRQHAFMLFNPLIDNSVESSQPDINFEITSISPNPATDVIEVSYSTEKPERVFIKLYNMQGVEIATIFDGYSTGQSIDARSFRTAGLSTGQYYVNMSVGDRSVTKIVNVIR